MNIVYLTSEALPFAKTGGLADVCGTLPVRVAALGHQATVIMPAFGSIRRCGLQVESTDISFAIPMTDQKLVGCRLLKSRLPDGDVPVWFIDQPQYFDRDSLYGTSRGDYPDNAERFTFFCRAAIQAIRRIGWMVDIVHCNDWQTGLVPALMAADSQPQPWMRRAATVMTIHNLAYQGQFSHDAFRWTGLDWRHFNQDEFEFHHHLNFLKTGIITADSVSTVSPKYAEEICTVEHGCGLESVLEFVSDHTVGIINGIDRAVWDPRTDPKLSTSYDISNWRDGKAGNKRSLQREFDLETNTDIPLIGLVGRLAEQKGWDLILPVLRWHLEENRPTQWIVLGSGDARYEHELRQLAQQHPKRFALHIGFHDTLAHRIEAGSDLFVMPSHYEPCGLNQLYSLRYGTIPVVTATGGLANTVVDCTEQTLAAGTATGFFLDHKHPTSLDQAIGRALHMRYHQPENWAQLVETGMSQDWSWTKSANQYIKLYEKTLALKHDSMQTPGK
ncbi:MAG: glycogen synthase GlgA [Pirellulales bacterium]|nr:glycogen synthase GlgA [Pirellulales bacterium]